MMVSDGIIMPASKPMCWVFTLLVVSKPNGSLRICFDPKLLNKAILPITYYMPTLDCVLPESSGVKVFSIINAKNGFYHLKLDED